MAIHKLIAAITPNFSLKELRAMVPWFNAVSDFVDNFFSREPTFRAAAFVSANAISQSYEFTIPLTHVSAGVYELFFGVPIDATTNYIATASLANLGAGDLVLYDIGVQIVDTTRIRIRIYSLADTAGATAPTPADHDFYVRVERLPLSGSGS